MLPYIKNYVNTFMGKSITTEQWRKHLYDYFEQHGGEEKIQALNSIDFKVEGGFLFLTEFVTDE
jgi:leukotriene-A4 hydrolase